MPQTQHIILSGLKVDTLIGVYDWERTRKTTLLFDVTVQADLSAAMQSDDVKDTIDYVEISKSVQETAAKKEYFLVEHLSNEITEDLFSKFNKLDAIKINVHKPIIEFEGQEQKFSGDVRVEIYRTRV